MVTCYGVYKNELQIKKYIEIEKVLTHFKTMDNFLKFSSKKLTDTAPQHRKEYFIKMLQEEI